MKKILSILSTISLSTIITTNIIACNIPNEENKPIKPEFTPQQPPLNSNWKLINDIENEFKIKNNNKYYFTIWEHSDGKTWEIKKFKEGFDINLIKNNSFKGLYRWDDEGEPLIPIIDNNTGEITDWKKTNIISCQQPNTNNKKLSNIITNTNLGLINSYNGYNEPTSEQIKYILKKENPKLEIDLINIIEINKSSSKIISNQHNFYNNKETVLIKYKFWNKNNGEINALVIDKNNNIYIGTKSNYNKGKIFKLTNDNINLIDNWNENNGEINALVIDKNNNIYIGTKTDDNKGKIFKLTNDNINLIDNWKENNGEILALVIDKNNNIYIGTKNTISTSKLFKLTNDNINLIDNWKENNGKINALVIDKNNNIYIATNFAYNKNGVFKLNKNKIIATGYDDYASGFVNALVIDKNNNIYMGTKIPFDHGRLFILKNTIKK